MSKIAVVYWSGTGNTEIMAKAVEEGAKSAGADTQLFETEDFSADKIKEYDAVAFGCPAMGDEELEDTVFEPLFNECKDKLSGKKVGLFGSYDWGDGDWMHTWEDNCKNAGAKLVGDGVIVNLEPDDEGKNQCRELGARLCG